MMERLIARVTTIQTAQGSTMELRRVPYCLQVKRDVNVSHRAECYDSECRIRRQCWFHHAKPEPESPPSLGGRALPKFLE